jgi:hypothetical protein
MHRDTEELPNHASNKSGTKVALDEYPPDVLAHQLNLAERVCITHSHGRTTETCRFTYRNGKSALVRPSGPLRALLLLNGEDEP